MAREYMDDAEIAVVAYGTTARIALTAVRRARERGIRAGLIRPVTVWPFPSDAIAAAAAPRFAIRIRSNMSAG